jgi:hypothetical protein
MPAGFSGLPRANKRYGTGFGRTNHGDGCYSRADMDEFDGSASVRTSRSPDLVIETSA